MPEMVSEGAWDLVRAACRLAAVIIAAIILMSQARKEIVPQIIAQIWIHFPLLSVFP